MKFEKASSDALLAGVDSAFTNTESTINYIYLYENDYNSAYASVAYFPKKGRTNYIKDSFSRFTMVSDNVYDIYTKNFSKDFYVNTREENFNGTDCWAIYSINKEDE